MTTPRHRAHRPSVAVATALCAVALTVSACGSDGATTTSDAATAQASEGVAVEEVDEARNAVDVAFAQQMVPHHRQAVQMADLAVEGAEDPAVLELAEQIRAAQQPEIDQLTAFLQAWGEEVPGDDGAGPVATGDAQATAEDHADHEGHEGDAALPMSGMVSAEDMATLGATAGPEFDRLFLELMVEHHEGAVEMAQTHLEQGENPQALALSEEIVRAQQEEIERMQELLAG